MSLDERLDALVRRDQDVIACPYPLFAELRAEDPVHFSESLGAWVVTRYDDVLSVLHDTDRFSAAMPTGPAKMDEVLGPAMAELSQDPEMAVHFAGMVERRGAAAVLLNADPPDHRRQRKLVNGAFRPSRIRMMEPLIEKVAHRLIDEFVGSADTGETVDVEFVSDFAVGLPMTLIAYALGVGDDDLSMFKQWSDDLVMPVGNPAPSVEQVRGYLVSSTEFAEYFSAMIADRQANPQEDIVSDVANAEDEGERLTLEEQLSMLTQFLVAGNETTTKLFTNMALQLASNPDLQQRIREDRSLVDGLVEEALRFEAPVGGLFRQAKEDLDVGGASVKKGEHVWVLYAAANRDESRFECPDDFDPARANVRDHIAFGHGEHFCIGASLARAEANIGFGVLLDRIEQIGLAENNFAYEDTFVLRGLKALNLTMVPA